MKKISFLLVLLQVCFVSSPLYAYTDEEIKKEIEYGELEYLFKESASVFRQKMSASDPIPEKLLRDCKGIAIFPYVKNAGFVVGGKYGKGVMFVKDEITNDWKQPAVFRMGGGSFGLQIGIQAIDAILIIMTSEAVDGLLKSRVKLGGEFGFATGNIGRALEASFVGNFKGGIVSYSKTEGVYIGAKLQGAVVSFSPKWNKILYGDKYTPEEILLANKLQTPQIAIPVLEELNPYAS